MRIVVPCKIEKALSQTCPGRAGRQMTDLARRVDRKRVNLDVKDDEAAALGSDGMIARYSNLLKQEGRELQSRREGKRTHIPYETAAGPLRPVLYPHTASLQTSKSARLFNSDWGRLHAPRTVEMSMLRRLKAAGSERTRPADSRNSQYWRIVSGGSATTHVAGKFRIVFFVRCFVSHQELRARCASELKSRASRCRFRFASLHSALS